MTLFPYTTLFRSLYCPAIAPTANHQGVDSTHRAAPVALRWSCTGKPPAVEAADGAGSGSKAGLQLWAVWIYWQRSEEHTSELQSRGHLVCRLLLEKKNKDRHAGSRWLIARE